MSKSKKHTKVRDLKPKKDAKGGGGGKLNPTGTGGPHNPLGGGTSPTGTCPSTH